MTEGNDMTSDDFPKTLTGRLIETAKVLGAISIITGFFGGMWAFTYGPVRDFLIQWEQMQTSIAQLQRDMLVQQGEDKVIREVSGLTYVSEPVYQGEDVVFNFVAARTRLGASCILRSTQPIFTDLQNTPTPGPRREAQLQITQVPSPLRPSFSLPINIRPGRVTVYLVLEYTCDGATVFDQTSVAAFELLRGPRPD